MGTPNFMELLRLKGIFQTPPMANDLPQQGGFGGNMGFPEPPPGPVMNAPAVDVQPPGTSMSAPMPAQSPSDRVAQEMARLYTPETTATANFNELLGNYPSREDYHPSALRRIGGALTAVGGSFDGHGGFRFNPNAVETGMNLRDEPINKKLSDWKNKIGPSYQAASLERTNNSNERTMAYQTVAQQLRAEADEARNNKNEKDALIRQQRADVYEFKARNPNLKLIMTKGGNVMAFNPADGSTKDTGIPTGSLTEADKMSMAQENSVERIEKTGDEQRKTEDLRQKGRLDVAETRGWKPYEETLPDGTKRTFMYNEISGEQRERTPGGSPQGATPVKPGGNTTGKTELPTQTKVRQYNLARELSNTRPDLAKFVRLGPGTNEFRITQPGKSFWGGDTGPSQDQVDEIEKSIYGFSKSEVPINQPTRTGKPLTPGVPQNTPQGSPNRPPVTNNGPTSSAADRTGRTPTIPKGVSIPPGEVAIAKDGKVIGTVREENLEEAIAQGYQAVRQ